MVSKKDPTIHVKNKLYRINAVREGLLSRWKRECLQKFPLGRKFHILYADPPWKFKTGNYAKSKSLNGLATYPTQSLEDIMAMPVENILAETAALFIWTTSPLMYETMKVIDSWNLKFVCVFNVWLKTYASGEPVFGTGRYSRGSTEYLLLARRGSGLTKWVKSHSIRQVVAVPRLGHSEKPDIFAAIVDSIFPDPNMNKLELYARKLRKGWSAWGLEVSAGKN